MKNKETKPKPHGHKTHGHAALPSTVPENQYYS